MYRKIRCPVLMIHGDNDLLQSHARAQAVADAVAGAELVTIEGGGHNPLGRIPAKTNALIVDFLDRKLGIASPARLASRSTRKAKRALYLSSPIGSVMAGAISRSRASCASCTRTWRSTGWRRIR
jgi:fermentation-respiration switch protein FrsA (DUF1100 family)